MYRLLGIVVALALATTAGRTSAQEAPPEIIVLDQERLFQESKLGQKIANELEQRSAVLAAENRTIEAQLIAEERELTERRTQLAPDQFRVLADAFDEKVERLRAEQDAKTRELVAIRDAGRQNFTQSVGPLLLDYMRRTGAAVMIDRRSVVATADRADVTDELIAVIDAQTTEVEGEPDPAAQVAPVSPDAPDADAAGELPPDSAASE